MSIRLRVTAVASVAVLGVLVVAGALLVVQQRRVLTESLEEGLSEEAAHLATLAQAGEVPDPIGGFLDDDAVAQVVGPGGEVEAATGGATPDEPLAPFIATGRRWRTIAVPAVDDGDFRALSVGAGDLAVHVAAPLDDVDEAVGLLTRSLAVAVPAVTALLAALVWWLVGRTLRPVEAIRAEVSAISGGALDRRVPEPAGDDEIGRLARTMNQMLGRLQRSAERQQQLAADASHELRSPLTRMRTELEVDLAHPESADLLRTHRRVLEEAEAMQRLVDDLLLLARSDAGALPQAEPVDLDEIVAEAAGRVTRAGLGADTTAVAPVRVVGDRRQLTRAIGNVVDNALRYATSTVTFEVGAAGDLAIVAVVDDGPGVEPDQRARIFERFGRADEARSRHGGGAGLGLAIARDVVERHGGTIEVDGGHHPGARFVIRLPRRGTAVARPHRGRPGSPP